MGIIWDVTRWVKSAAKTVKNAFTNDDKPSAVEKPQTLNQQIETNKIWQRMPTSNVGSFPITSNIQNLNLVPQENNVPKINFWTWDTQDIPSTNMDQVKKESKWFSMPDFIWMGESIFQKIYDYDPIKKLSDWGSKQQARNQYKDEVEKNTKKMYLWFNPQMRALYSLAPQDQWAFEERLEMYYNELEWADTYAEQQKARDSFYNDTMKQFKLSREWYNEKYSNFTEDELSTLSNNWITKGWNYEPTRAERDNYIDTLYDNAVMQRDTYNKYKDRMGVTEEPTPMSETLSNFSWELDDILYWDWVIESLINQNISSEKRWAAYRNINEIEWEQRNRQLPSVEYLFRVAEEAEAKPELQRTQAELDIIEAKKTVEELLKQAATNRRDFYIRELNEWTKDWDITQALDRFEDWSSLNDVLTNWMFEISWLEKSGPDWMDVSPISIINKYTNNAVYNYKKATEWNVAKRVWNWLEHAEEPLWYTLWERWQQALWVLPMNFFNMFTGKWQAATSAYLDNDFSMGRLIETDDGPNKRTIQRYALQFMEYAPEWIANVAPDLALIALSWWWTAPTLLRKVWQLSKVSRFMKVQNAVNEIAKANKLVDKSLKWLKKVKAIWDEWANINTKNKRVWNTIDRALTQFAVWQHMDAQLSSFDTEPYSDTSFKLSVFWGLLWDFLPEAKDLWWVWRNWTKWWKALTKWTGVWDLVDFISESDENANAIARAMWKRKATFSEQDLKDYVRTFGEVTDAAKAAYEGLSKEWKVAANQRTKELMYNYVKQNYWANSNIWKAVREILVNKNTSPADIIKYTWAIPGIVEIWPYKSIIQLSHWTLAWVEAKWWWFYDIALDAINGWFGDKVTRGFTFSDIQDLSKIKGYEDVLNNRGNLFRKVETKTPDWRSRTLWYLTEDGLDRFWLEAKNLTTESLWVSLSDAENVREILKEKMADLKWNKLTKETIDALADWWWYNEVVSKIENILC